MMPEARRFRLEAIWVIAFSATLLLCAWQKWFPIDLTESWGFATGAACVWLVTRGNIWNWPIGLANNIVFAVLFWRTKLYADFGLQGVYFALGIWGWWHWLHGGANQSKLTVSRTQRWEWISIAVFLTLGTWGLHELLVAAKGSSPRLDAVTTALSLAAQYLLSRKRLENWWLWIAADLIYVPLYFSKQLPLTGILYAGFIGLCIVGLIRWKKELATP